MISQTFLVASIIFYNLLSVPKIVNSDFVCNETEECIVDPISTTQTIRCEGYRSCFNLSSITSTAEDIECTGLDSCKFAGDIEAYENLTCNHCSGSSSLKTITDKASIECQCNEACANIAGL